MKKKQSIPEPSPTQDVQLEALILGAMIADPQAAVTAVMQVLPHAGCFNDARHRMIFSAFKEMHGRGRCADLVSLADALAEQGKLAEAGNITYLADLPTKVSSPIYAESWSWKLLRLAQKREIKLACLEAAQASDTAASSDEIIGKVENELEAIGKLEGIRPGALIGSTIADLLNSYDDLKKGKVKVISTGFSALDKVLIGWHPGNVISLAGRPSMGKTALALAFIRNAAKAGAKCLLFSLEMTRNEIVERLMSAECNYDSQKFRRGQLSQAEYSKLLKRSQVLMDESIWIEDSSEMTLMQICATASRFKEKWGLDLVVIDYLGLVELGYQAENQNIKISAITRTIKGLAKKLNLPIILISQLSRALEQRRSHRPILSDLRDSGSIEQDSDVVVFIHREGKFDKKVNESETEIIIGKQRMGPTNVAVQLSFDLKTGSFLGKSNRVEETEGVPF